FIKNYIIETNTKHVVVGFDFTFGFKAKGNVNFLRKESRNKQFDLTVIPKKTYLNDKISSTKLRELIRNGEVAKVPYYLGAHYHVKLNIRGVKKQGKFIARNVDNQILPKLGVYQVEVLDG